MHILDIPEYKTQIGEAARSTDISFLKGKSLLISGASGMVMSYFIDTLLFDPKFDVHICAVTSSGSAKARFREDSRIDYLQGDVCNPQAFKDLGGFDYVIHAASITDPKGYAARPIETMLINIEGTKNLLDVAFRCGARFLLVSSCEVYGEADIEPIPEDYCGKLNPMDVRSCYNESKRASETLCVSYAKQKGVEVVIARLSRIFGPTMSLTDTKALSQFLMNGVKKKPIILKSEGKQRYSYTYAGDAVTGILCLLKKGENCQAYNVCNPEALSLKEVAGLVAKEAGVDLRIDLGQDPLNKAGYTRTINAIQDPAKIMALGWVARYSLTAGIRQTLLVLEKRFD